MIDPMPERDRDAEDFQRRRGIKPLAVPEVWPCRLHGEPHGHEEKHPPDQSFHGPRSTCLRLRWSRQRCMSRGGSPSVGRAFVARGFRTFQRLSLCITAMHAFLWKAWSQRLAGNRRDASAGRDSLILLRRHLRAPHDQLAGQARPANLIVPTQNPNDRALGGRTAKADHPLTADMRPQSKWANSSHVDNSGGNRRFSVATNRAMTGNCVDRLLGLPFCPARRLAN